MSTFQIPNDDYSVEEISYDDMMVILSTQTQGPTQGQENTDSQLELSENTDSQLELSESHDSLKNKVLPETNDLSQRIAENANRQLPDWLLNH